MTLEVDMDAVLRQHATTMPDEVALRFLKNGEDDIVDLTYQQLNSRAAYLARQLKQRLAPGARVMLVLNPGLDYVTALFAIFKANMTAVPSFPPVGTRAVSRFANICNDCKAQLVIAEDSLEKSVDRLNASLSAEGNCPEWLFIGSDFFETADAEQITPETKGDEQNGETFPALLQYTSGSTGHPKGVVLSAANLISNSHVLDIRLGAGEKHMGFSWLPPYHDMGLMGAILLSLYRGFTLVMMTPAQFVQRPLRWLKGMSTHKVTVSPAPNFALDLCVDTITDEEVADLDLSNLKLLFCGAEPVRKATLDRFTEKFKPAGFSSGAFIPCYGLAEATLFISGKSKQGAAPKSLLLDQELLASGVAQLASADAPATAVISCGTVASDHTMIIVDPETQQRLQSGKIGELWFKGANVAQGYLNQTETSAEVFNAFIADNPHDGSYLRTGDFGFILDEELYVVGRIKDVMIFAGRNLYPQDIEATAQASHSAIRTNGVVAFSVMRDDAEQLAVVAEILRTAKLTDEELKKVQEAIAAAITRSHGVAPHTVHLAPVSTIPLTTSGKLRRSACRDAFNAGTLAYAKGRARPSTNKKEQALKDGDIKARRLAYMTVLTPAIGFVAALCYSIQFGFKQQDLMLFGVMYLLTSFGVEGGLHRFFSHRAFKAGPVVTAIIGILGCMAAQGPILFWSATHRMHHAFTDQDGDPHSPRALLPGLRGRIKAFWHSHVGWLYTIKRNNWSTYVPDLFESRLVLFINQHYLTWVLFGLALPTAIGAMLCGIEGAVGGLLWGGLARIFLLDQVTWAVNSLGHIFGKRPNQTRDTSGNIGWLALVSCGGGWHNNHHANPGLAHNDFHFWQIDMTGLVIRCLGMVGLVWNVRERQKNNEKIR